MARGSRAGERRGRYRADGSAAPASAALPDVGPTTELDALLDRLRAESPLKHAAAKELGVRALRSLLLEAARLDALAAAGALTGDEAKARTAVASNTRRWFETLGVTEKRDPDEDDDGGF